MYKCTLHCYALKCSMLLLGSTYRYTDGSGRKLDGMDLPVESNLQPISNRAYPVKGEHWQPMIIDEPSPHKGIVMIAGGGVVGLVTGIAFALRGWHTTILEKSSPLPPLKNKNNISDDDNISSVEQECNSSRDEESNNFTIDIDEDDFNIWDNENFKNTVKHIEPVSSSVASKVNNNNDSNNYRSRNGCLASEHVQERNNELLCEEEQWRKELEESYFSSGKEQIRPVKINCMRYKLQRPHYELIDNNNNNTLSDVSISCSARKCNSKYSGSDYDEGKIEEVEGKMSTSWPTFLELQYALLTRRGLDALESIGLRLDKVRTVGVKVRGVIDHAGAFNNWLTWRLNEEHSFAINMLSIDLFALRQLLEQHAQELPNNNLCIFHEHVVEMVHPFHQQLVIKPVAQSSMAKEYELEKEILSHSPSSEEQESYMCVNSKNEKETDNADRVSCSNSAITKSKEKELPYKQQQQRWEHVEYLRRSIEEMQKEPNHNLQNSLTTINRTHDTNIVQHKRCESSLTLSSLKWNAKYAPEAVQYDLLVCAEGVNSRLRDVLDVEGFAADDHFGVKWFLLQTSALSHEHIHRWLYKSNPDTLPHLRFTRGKQCASVDSKKSAPIESNSRYSSSIQSSMCMAFPRIDGNDMFSVMVYMPSSILRSLTDTEILTHYLSDVLRHDALSTLRSFTTHVSPCPTIFCENLHNSVGLPSAVMIGDAAHHCHPFWMQNLAMGLEDGLHLLTHVDAYSRHFYDAIRLFSAERGVDGDALRILTERCLFYEQRKHANPFIRFRNVYRNTLQMYVPVKYNNKHGTHSNARYSKSIESMLNGRGYTSYKFAEEQQVKHNSFWKMSRLYTESNNLSIQ